MKKLEQSILESYILSLPDTWKDYPFDATTAVYKHGEKDGNDKMFVLIDETSDPIRVSLKCDPQLAEVLREKYETVLPGYHLNKKHWNTIVCTGQIEEDEMRDLIRHSFELVR